MTKIIGVAALASALLSVPVFGQTVGTVNAPIALNSSGQPVSATPIINIDPATGNPITPPSAPAAYQLLTNASASGTAVTSIAGGGYILDLSGTFGGTSATFQVTDSSGTYQTIATCTVACTVAVNISQGSSAKVVLTGGSPTAMNAKLGGVGGPIANITAPISADTVIKATAVDRGLVVTTAGSAQQMMAANTLRRGYVIQNQSSGACYVNAIATATQDYHSLQISAGVYYETPPTHVGTGAVSVICDTSSASIYVREF